MAAALSALATPTSGVKCSSWRCRLESSTASSSTIPIRPTPAPARYSATGEPSAPAPITSTCASPTAAARRAPTAAGRAGGRSARAPRPTAGRRRPPRPAPPARGRPRLACAAAAASSRKNPRRLFTPRTIRIVVPSTATACPAAAAERGTFSSASPGAAAHLERLPGAIRSSSSFVRTQVIGQVSAVMSSVRAAIADTVAAALGALLPHPPRLRGLRPRPLADLAGRPPAQRRAPRRLPRPAGGERAAAGGLAPARWRTSWARCRTSPWWSATRSPASSGCTIAPRPGEPRPRRRACCSSPRRRRRPACPPSSRSSRCRSTRRRSPRAAGETRIVCARDPLLP